MEGSLFTYDAINQLVGFRSGPVNSNQFIVFVAGIGESFLSVGYLPQLQARLSGFQILQLLTRSSLSGYGTGSLHRDMEDINTLIKYLYQKNGDIQSLYLMGFSTGTNDIVWFLKNSEYKENITGVILQGPVSDRQFYESMDVKGSVKIATDLVNSDRGNELMPVETDEVPITAYRFHSFTTRLSDDDMFSTDLTEQELINKLGHISVPCLIAFSENDEFVPEGCKVGIPILGATMCKVVTEVGKSELCKVVYIDNANHAITNTEGIDKIVHEVGLFIDEVEHTSE
eukprot:TRINITY_DN3580_c0_g2_i1.p1 TRINITY_DN3580_c0_g2~~TRINITY_DN3580_c0_g2_i1.p1  ORF type:complete len:286 (+),score=51.85 TRINITY_DN3580_c0_g2_i1:53-910(+)